MNNTIKCVNGLCDHPEHTVNGLIWLVPAAIAVCLMIKLYKKYS